MAHGRVTEGILGDVADHRRFIAEAGERECDIALGPADADVEIIALKQQLAAGRTQAKQQLPKTDDLHAASA